MKEGRKLEYTEKSPDYALQKMSHSPIVKQRMCTPELELMYVSLRPRYLPREFGRMFVTVVYAAVYDSTSAARAGKAIAAAVRDLQLISADAPCFIVGDFNHCDLRKALPPSDSS